jgi:hypothetical protein
MSGYKVGLLALVAIASFGCAQEADYGADERDAEVYPRFEENYGAPDDTAGKTGDADVEELGIGWGIDTRGVVPENMRDDRFGTTDTIHLSMKVNGTTPAQKVRLVVFDEETDQQVMSTEKNVDASNPMVHFTIDKGKLASGDYRAEVMIGADTVAEESFSVTTETITRDPNA